MSTVTISVLNNTPSQERAEYLRGLYTKWVKHPGGHWKGPATATVPDDLLGDVGEAMDFMGSIVDDYHEDVRPGYGTLVSDGYWAHGF